MGMFDKRQNFEDYFKEGDKVILINAKYQGKIKTREGDADLSLLRVRVGPGKAETLGILGAGIASQVRDAEPGDFPCVVEFGRVSLSGDRQMKVLAPVAIGEAACRDFAAGKLANATADYSRWQGAADEPGDAGSAPTDDPGF